MNEPPSRDVLSRELENERAIRRAAKLLAAKRSRIRDDLDCLIDHLALLMPRSPHTATQKNNTELLIEAAGRLDDEVFKELLIQVIREQTNFT